MRKYRKLFIVLLLITMSFTQVSFAGKSTGVGNEQNVKDNYFTQTEILMLADHYVSGYLSESYKGQNTEFIISKNFTELYDTSDNHFAHLIQFSTVDGIHNGTLSLGALRNGIVFYELTEDLEFFENSKAFNSGKQDKIIIFVPPMNYFAKAKNDKTSTYELFGRNLGEQTILKSNESVGLEKKNDVIIDLSSVDIYEHLQSDEYEKYNSSILDQIITNDDNSVLRVSRAGSSASLSKWSKGQFLPVDFGTYYGGAQAWYGSNSGNGCGPTAASNILAYLDDKNSSSYGNLYQEDDLSTFNYTYHMIKVYNYLSPINPFYGLTSVSSFTTYVENYASEKSVNLNGHYITAKNTGEQTVINFIKAGLNADTPVAALNLSLPNSFKWAWHWVTITAFNDNGHLDNEIVISSWGRKYTVNFLVYYLRGYGNGGGYAYFY